MKDILQKAAKAIVDKRHIVAFTGAGVSQESGIATFRDPGGLWDQFDPVEFGTLEGIVNLIKHNPKKLIDFLQNSLSSLTNAKPNHAHIAIAEFEKMGLLDGVVTQNIDNLHQEAGNKDVLEVHGNIYRFRCSKCGETVKLTKDIFIGLMKKAIIELNTGSLQDVIDIMPTCNRCGGKMRLDVVLFGEAVQMIPESYKSIEQASVVLIVGTSGTVYPASEIPRYGKSSGAVLVDVNPKETFYADIDNYFLKGPAGTVLPQLLEEVKILIQYA